MPHAEALPQSFGPMGPLIGTAAIPGDKSISHRALMLAAIAEGQSRISGLSQGEDVAATAAALRAMGVSIVRHPDGDWRVDGVGLGGLHQPATILDMGNSGTSARLLMGLIASHPISAGFTGDASLRRRPMDRIVTPLRSIGAAIDAGTGERLPLTLHGSSSLRTATHRLGIASAQVKSALLLAALNTPGETRIVEPVPTRDHSERMMAEFGADIAVAPDGIAVTGGYPLRAQHIIVPGDPSSAAFLAVAALIVPGSEIRMEGIGVNPMRTGLYATLQRMGAHIVFSNRRMVGGEPVADMTVRSSRLCGVDVLESLVPAMIDEFPIFFVAAAFASGVSRAHGLAELRIKESDRIGAMAKGLKAIGANVRESADGLEITGSGGVELAGGTEIASALDHRVAMSFAVAGLGCAQPVRIDDMRAANTSFPGFAATLAALSA